MSDSVRPHKRQPTRLPGPWDSPGKNTGVGCHFLLQCLKVKSESEVAQSCPTPSDPMDCSPPAPSIHGIFQARVLEWVAIAFSELRPTKAELLRTEPNNFLLQFCFVCHMISFNNSDNQPVFRSAVVDCLYLSHQFSSVAQSCPTLCEPMDCSTPGLPVHHQLLEFIQTHIH